VSAEIAHVQRIAPVCPPRADSGVVAAGVRERAAEKMQRRKPFLTQSHKDPKAQREIQSLTRRLRGRMTR